MSGIPPYLEQANDRYIAQTGQKWNQESPWDGDGDDNISGWLQNKPAPGPPAGGGWGVPQPQYTPQPYQQPYAPQQQYAPQYPQPYNPYQQNGMKGFFGSKTVWAGIVTALASVFSWFQASEVIQSHPQMTSMLGAGIGLMMVLLRLLTNKPVSPPNVTIRKVAPPKGWPR